MSKNKDKKEHRKPKYIRDAEKAHDANVYNMAFQHGYDMGFKAGKALNNVKSNENVL